jgi:hypothetical protein
MGNGIKRKTPGSYTVGDSELFAQLGESLDPNLQQKTPPEMRVGRATNIEDPLSYGWHTHLDRLGRKNYGRGKAVALGSIALTYVNAKENGAMLLRKFPDLFGARVQPKRILQTYRRFAEEYNAFARENDRIAVEARNAMMVDFQDEAQDLDEAYRQWGVGAFTVRPQPYSFGKNDLSVLFHPQDEEVLREEMRATWDFYRASGFDTRLIDRNRRPHLVKLETFRPIGQVSLRSEAQPMEIGLMPPHALVCDNSPLPLR